MKEKYHTLVFIKIKNFCSWKDTIEGIKGQATNWEAYLQIKYTIKDLQPDNIKNYQNIMPGK